MRDHSRCNVELEIKVYPFSITLLKYSKNFNFPMCFAFIQILVYEYMKNGNLGEHISSKTWDLSNVSLVVSQGVQFVGLSCRYSTREIYVL